MHLRTPAEYLVEAQFLDPAPVTLGISTIVGREIAAS
jgi:hypothetical protein